MKTALVIYTITILFAATEATKWALLAASSNGWINYRHQSDICHAYQLLKARGFPEENIIVMMYDDVAYNEKNPFPGKIFNHPNGPDVYKGVKIDYKGNDVTPNNFLNVLSGNKQALKGIGTGRVVESTKDDTVFVYFVDHGSPGSLSFPNQLLYADGFENTLKTMSQKENFKQMLMYIEACESGSMFDNILGEDSRILVMTAAAREESSWGFYCNEKTFNYNCLGDLFSITWMEHLEKMGNLADKETIFHNFDVVRTGVVQSHVEIYGDYSIGYKLVEDFFGPSAPQTQAASHLSENIMEEAVMSRDIPLHIAKESYVNAEPSEKIARSLELIQLNNKRHFGDTTFNTIITESMAGEKKLLKKINQSHHKLTADSIPCYKSLVEGFEKHCFKPAENNYILRHLYKFANICAMKTVTPAKVIETMKIVCTHEHKSTTDMQ